MVAEDEATLEMLRAAGFFGIREKVCSSHMDKIKC